ncbi:MAG: carboxypeptidase regulatory-like domain-containing protein [Bacteroidetes bacterium]|nr:carboxypeptidase regulatory-like domain-containing protein [Bacteroidota bacterium]
MRLLASHIWLRISHQFLLGVVFLCAVSFPAFGQNITLKSPSVERGGQHVISIMFRTSDVVTLSWKESIEGLNFKIGQIPGTYGLKSIRMRGNQASSFSPGVVGLPVGVYYGVITNATSNTFTEIQIEASANAQIRYSAEFMFVVESVVAPRIISPKGTITERVPTIEWEAIPGVVSYAIIVSSTPFTISLGPTGEAKVEGVNPVWIHLTTNTSARYGERPETNPLVEFNPLPLVPGRTYYYTVLNAYSKVDPSLLSYVIGSVVSFTLQDRGTLTPAQLIHPTRNTRVVGDDFVEFSWAPVVGAVSYDLSVYERITDVSALSDVQVFSGNTPNEFLTVSASRVFREGDYRWFIIANDREGAGSVSDFGTFHYDAEMGSFVYHTKSAIDGADVLGVVVKGRSTDGGYNPSNSYINSNGAIFLDSLVVGNYEFTATKIGFAEKIIPVQIRKGELISFDILLNPLPSRINGQVVDQNGFPVENVSLSFNGVASGELFTTKTNSAGIFSKDITAGTFRIAATKAGYRASIPITVSVLENQSISLPTPLRIIHDNVSISGRVTNQDGIPISQAEVTATLGTQSHSIVTNGDGRWSLALSEGVWTVSANKEGFLAPVPRELSLFAQDVITNIDFVLIQQASRIEGTVLGTKTLSDGRVEKITLVGATVKAYPLSGPGISVKTDNLGRYSLDLGTGFYSVFTEADGYDRSQQFDFIIRPNEIFREVKFTVEELTSTTFGRVVDAKGVGVEGVTVMSSLGFSTISQSGGTFILKVPSSIQKIRAWKTGFLPSKEIVLSPGKGTQISGVSLTIFPNAANISGTVRSTTGVIAGVRIKAVNGPDSYETISNGLGEYQLQLPGGNWQISAKSPRYRLPLNYELFVRSGQSAESVHLNMVADFVRLDGFLTSGATGVTGAIIQAVDVDQSRGFPITLSTITGTGGRYSALLSASTRFELTVDHPGFNRLVHSVTTDVPGSSRALNLILAPSEAIITGKVKDSNGFAISGALAAMTVGGITQFSTLSEADGSFQLNVEAGSYNLIVNATGFKETTTPLQLSAGQRIDDISITLTSAQSTLIATIIDPRSGSLISGAFLTATGPEFRTGISSAEGIVTFSNLTEGSYQIEVKATGFTTVLRTLSIPLNITSRQTFILVPVFGKITGRVQGSDGGALTDATVRMEGSATNLYSQTDANGSYTFEGVPDGGYSISAQKNGYSIAPSVQVAVSISNRNVTAATIRLVQNTGIISGIARDKLTGVVLSGVVIVATSQAGTKSARSDSEGRYEFTGMEPGVWTLNAQLENYRFVTTTVQVTNGQTSSLPIELLRNQAVITGRIRSKNGQLLPFDVAVEIKTSREQYRVFTDPDGRFVVDQIPQGETVTVKTGIQRERYRDKELAFFIPVDATQFSTGDIEITTLSATINGSSGIEGSTVFALDAQGATVAIVSSLVGGTFKIPFLEPGTYQLVPSRLGYQFSPARMTVIVGEDETRTVSFSVTSNVGLINVSVRRQDGTGVIDIPVRISSFDRSIDQTLRTDASGNTTPQQIPLGLKYRVEPVSSTNLFSPTSREIDFTAQTSASISFTLFGINSFISGQTKDTQGGLLSAVTVTAKTTTSQDYVSTSTNGQFTIGPVPPGIYSINARKTGFISAQTQVNVAENSTISGIQLVLQRQSVEIKGKILRAGIGVPGMNVLLSGPVSLSGISNGSGEFLFSNVPVSEAGETALEIAILRPGRPSIIRRLSVSNANVGQTIELESIILASGVIAVQLSNGESAIPGIEITVTGGDGGIVQGVTNQLGQFASAAVLDPGSYVINLVNSPWLQPSITKRTVVLTALDSHQAITLTTPFSHTAGTIFRSDKPIPISITSVGPTAHLDKTARIFYQLPGREVQSIAMSFVEGSFTQSIPTPGEGKVTYYVEVFGSGGLSEFKSANYERTTVVAGQLQESRLFPDLNGQILRVGDQYGITLQIRDGLGGDISADVVARGSVEWIPISGNLGIDLMGGQNKLFANLTTHSEGPYELQVRVTLLQKQMVIPIRFEAKKIQVSQLNINAQSVRVLNRAGTARFSVSGEANTGGSVLLGTSVFWSLEPEFAASIDQNGSVTTINENYIGPIVVHATDSQSGVADSSLVAAFAEILGDRPRTLTDFKGMELFIPAASIPFRSELSLSYPRTPVPKRFDSGSKSAIGLTAGLRTYRFSLKSDRALVGDTLAVPATLTLFSDAALRLYQGEKQVGHFDESSLSWQSLPSSSLDQVVVTDLASRLGDYAVVSRNLALGIRNLEVLPSPFSPDVAPLKIGYFLDTNAPPAAVSIHVLNIRGELVKTLLDGDQQWAGPYGGRNGIKQVEWDGTTENNQKARNGRYIIRVTARDNSGTSSQLIPVVLIK